MPLLTCATMELTDHVFWPLTQQIAHRILVTLDLDKKIDHNIYLNSDFSSSARTRTHEGNAIVADNALRVELNINLNPTSQKWDYYTFKHTAAYQVGSNTLNHTPPIYADDENRVKIVETISPVTLTLNCVLQVQDAETAYQLPQKIFNRFETGAIVHYNDLVFDYPVPKPILSILFIIWEYDRLKGKPTGKDFYTYLYENSRKLWQSKLNRDIKDEHEVVVPVYNLQALGTLEYSDEKPNAVKDEDVPVYFEIPFTYTIQFAMPTLNIFEYPCIICNQLLPETAIPYERNGIGDRFNTLEGSDVWNYIREVRPELRAFKHPNTYLQVPFYDDWIIPVDFPPNKTNMIPFLIINALLDENETLTTTIPFKEWKDNQYIVSPWVYKILELEGEDANERDNLINIQIFRNNRPLIAKKDYTITENITVNFKGRTLADHYRLVMSTFSDLRKVNGKYWWIIKEVFDMLPYDFRVHICNVVNSIGMADRYIFGNHKVILQSDGYFYYNQSKVCHISETDFPAGVLTPVDGSFENARARGKNYAAIDFSRVFVNTIIARKQS